MNRPIDLRPQDQALVEQILHKVLPSSAQVWVFGSRARWTARDGSDLDLAIDAGRPLRSEESEKLRHAFEESDLPFTVDTVDWTMISEEFRTAIKNDMTLLNNEKKMKLGEHCYKIGSGATPKGGKETYISTGPFALIRSQNVLADRFSKNGIVFISNEQAAQLSGVEVFPGDVLLNITGDSVARVCQVDPTVLPACVNQHVMIIRPNPDEIDPRFLRYFLASQSMQDYMKGLAASGATRNALTKGMVENFNVPPFPIALQRQIGMILGVIDEKIDLNRRMNETLEATARALFKSWFIDFDPVRAKSEGCDTGLPRHIADLFPDSFKDSELGKIPTGWNIVAIDNCYNIIMGQSPPGDTYNNGGNGLPFYQGCTDFGFRFPTRRIYCAAPSRVAEKGDTLVSVRAPVGDMNMAIEPCCVGRGVAAVRHYSSSRAYTFYAMNSMKKMFHRFNAEGTVFGSIGKRDFHSIRCLAPCENLIQAFDSVISPFDDRIENAEQEIQTLTALHDALLPKLISGELRVRDAERILEKSA